MRLQEIFVILSIVFCADLWAQQDSIAIKEIVVTDNLLREYSGGQHVQVIPDSVLRRDPGSLTRLLQFHSTLYFKENGLGMVSSPAFRGTTAQQTAVVWNGVNLHSALNGQTDFNAIAITGGDLTIRPGGGSFLFGSNAIGGSLHYNSTLSFDEKISHRIGLQYGSFNTANASYAIKGSSGKVAFNVGVFRNSSDNDYEWPDGRKNLNGQFYNSGFDASAGVKISDVHQIRFYSRLFNSERHFSLIVPSETKTKYRDFNTSNMLEWSARYNKITATTKAAFLDESYGYYENLEAEPQTGNAETFLVRHDIAWRITEKFLVQPLVEYNTVKGWGTNIEENRRETFSGSVLAKYRLFESLRVEGGIRQELISDYDSPLLYSMAWIFKKGWYTLKLNGSKNFRIPTFNDMYWGDGGNPDLKPESSLQAEISQTATFDGFELSATAFAINITDMIQWLPGESAAWFPRNVHEVYARGVEASAKYDLLKGKHHLQLSGTYAYTESENRETRKQLIFVPYHKGTFALAYAFRRFELTGESLYTGEVFTRGDNNPRYNLDRYFVVNSGIAYQIDKKHNGKIGINIRNLLDTEYMTQPRRPYPGRHFTLNLNLTL